MPEARVRAKEVIVEGTKVLIVFTAFFLLQSQIFDIRGDFFGHASGLARAQARTSDALGSTRERFRRDLERSTVQLARTHRELLASVGELTEERSRLRRSVEKLTEELEPDLRQRIDQERSRIRDLQGATQANASDIEILRRRVRKDTVAMKRRMLFPTVQLRGNGTVGSGVLVYSERQVGGDGTTVHSTFLLTACHVVAEVLGGIVAPGRRLEELRIHQQEGEEPQEVTGRVVIHDRDLDIALLQVESTRHFPYLADPLPREEWSRIDVFSPAYAVGCPLGNRPMPTLGEVSSRSKKVGSQVFWMLNAPTFFGNSGGGVYTASGYRLIGVSSMIYTYGKSHPTVVPHMGLFVPLESICAWLEREGYDFVLARKPVPDALRRRLVWSESEPAGPRPSAASLGPDPADTEHGDGPAGSSP